MVVDPGSVKVYTVNGAVSGSSSSLPDWLTRKRAANRKSKREIRERIEGTIELIQHFEFPEASNRIKTTRDGHHAIATGTYKPQMRVWDLDQLSLKFERHSDAENVDFIILSDDWTKTIHLQNDRSIELHNQSGFYYKTRIPRFGRALGYHFPSCDVLVAATGPEVYRLNLDQGRFLNPLLLQGDGNEDISGVNCIDINSTHQLWAFGCEGNGSVELWDPRSRAKVGILRLPSKRLMPTNLSGMENPPLSVTAISSRSDGLSYVIGTSTGHSLLYDIRSSRPYATKDQGYGFSVKKVTWIEGGHKIAGDGMILSADKKVVKVWDRNDASSNFTSITPANDLNDVHHVPASGLIMLANEGIQMATYYIPQLGPAPRWCSFLENITEEMEDQNARTVYEDYKFVGRNELSALGLDHLVGTPALKPYMHGYFLSLKLYDTARAIANPFAYAEHRERVVREKLDKMAESRIRAPKNMIPNVKVNKGLAERIAKEQQRERSRKDKRKQSNPDSTTPAGESENLVADEDMGQQSLVNDPRFKALFEDPEFEVDENSREFALMNPSLAASRKDENTHRADQHQKSVKTKTAVEEEEETDMGSSSSSENSSQSGDGNEDLDEDDSSEDDDLIRNIIRASGSKSQKEGTKRTLQDVRLVPLQTLGPEGQNDKDRDATFGQRRRVVSPSTNTSTKNADRISRTDGITELSWTPSSKRKFTSADGEASDAKKRKKGIETFGLGMEKGDSRSSSVHMSENERSGRTQRRKGMRSGSKNAFRKI